MIEGRANELPDFQVFRTVLYYCFVIIALPVISFFTSKVILFDGILQLSTVTSNVSAAVVAVIALHLALGAYIYKAYSEPDKAAKPMKKD